MASIGDRKVVIPQLGTRAGNTDLSEKEPWNWGS